MTDDSGRAAAPAGSSGVGPCPLPPAALLGLYGAGAGYADCYAVVVARSVCHAEYVAAFYTTPLFRIERAKC